MINVCPETSAVAVRHRASFLGLFRLCDLPAFSSLNPEDRVRVMLGNPPATLLRKNIRVWTERAPVICAAFSYDLLTTISEKTPPLTLDPMSWCHSEGEVSSEGEDDFHQIVPPPGFSPGPTPTDALPFQPLHPAGQSLVGRTIFYNWRGAGWCMGTITHWNADRNLKVGRRVANFLVYYACDTTTATHFLDFESYNHTHNGLSPCQTWLFLTPDPPAP